MNDEIRQSESDRALTIVRMALALGIRPEDN